VVCYVRICGLINLAWDHNVTCLQGDATAIASQITGQWLPDPIPMPTGPGIPACRCSTPTAAW
jgi:hypothetical protein